jgi:hypothetical protein
MVAQRGGYGHPLETTPTPVGGLGDLEALWPFSASEEAVFMGSKMGFMLGKTSPLAIVTPRSSLPSSSSFLIANSTCLGLILFFLLSRAAFPASSSTYISLYTTTQHQPIFPIFYLLLPNRESYLDAKKFKEKSGY